MPKLPKGMFKRGRSFYIRDRKGGRDRWISLGTDYGDAVHRVRLMRRGEHIAPDMQTTVSQPNLDTTLVPSETKAYGRRPYVDSAG